MYLSPEEVVKLRRLLITFFSLPYSTDLDGKDAETLLRIVKGSTNDRSKRKELFDIIDGNVGYSVKTLRKRPNVKRVDLQEQRFCNVDEVRELAKAGGKDEQKQGQLILEYMRERIVKQMRIRSIQVARSLILLKDWDKDRRNFQLVYWEEDFLGYIDQLCRWNAQEHIEWVVLPAGIYARKLPHPASKAPVRLLRMHYKHNQIFTDHDVPADAVRISFEVHPLSWEATADLLVVSRG